MERTKNFQPKVRADTVKGGILVGVNFPYMIIRAKIDQKRPKNGHFGTKSAPNGLKFHHDIQTCIPMEFSDLQGGQTLV